MLLLGALGVLQYHWLGQVSAAEIDRLRAGLRHRGGAFAGDVDRELARIVVTFSPPFSASGDVSAARIAEQSQRWQAHAPYPGIVGDIYRWQRTEADPDGILLRFDSGKKKLVLAPWPESLSALRNSAWRPGPLERGPFDPGPPEGRRLLYGETSALVLPDAPPFGRAPGRFGRPTDHGMTIVRLDRAFIEQQWLPQLARRHFDGGPGPAYLVNIESADGTGAIFRTPGGAAMTAGQINEEALPLFRVRPEDMNNVLAGTSTGDAFGRPFGPRLGRWAQPAQWRLLLAHPSGPLEQVVARLRRRNLLVAFGIIGVLGASIALLSVAMARAQRAARQQGEFIAGVSHELRTPLAVIGSAAENLADGVVPSATSVRQYGALIHREATRLMTLIEQVLEFAGSRQLRAPIKRSDVDMASVVEAALADYSADIEEGRVSVNKTIGAGLPHVLGDPEALRRSVGNLISNAIKYGGDDPWLGVHMDTAPGPGGPEISVTVQDRGLGIPPAEGRRIGEPFFRGRQAVERQIRGSGLGLSLVKRIIEGHRGKLSFDSAPGFGSRFTIRIPAVDNGPVAEEPRARTNPPH